MKRKPDKIEIVRRIALSPDEQKWLKGWGEDVFDTAALGPPLKWRSKTHHFILQCNGITACHVGTLVHDWEEEGRSLRLLGVGGVVTRPEFQGKGFARAALAHALAVELKIHQPDFGLLFCLERLTLFYARMGWKLHPHPVRVEQEAESLIFPGKTMTWSFSEEAFPLEAFELGSLPW